MEKMKLSNEQLALLAQPLPPEAVSPHPSKSFLSSIKSIYVTERLNEVFGVGAWSISTEFIEREGKMIVVKVVFEVAEYGIRYECFGGNDNADLGDAYKGATTDAMTKIGSWLGIGADVFKGKQTGKNQPRNAPKPQQQAKPTKKVITFDDMMNDTTRESLYGWVWKADKEGGCSPTFDSVEYLTKYYDIDKETAEIFRNGYGSFRVAKMTPKL